MKLKEGDSIVYATGRKVKIVGFPDINGEPGVQINHPGAIFASQTFKAMAEVDSMVKAKVWTIEKE